MAGLNNEEKGVQNGVRRVLVVEGNQTVRSSLYPFFQNSGWELFGAASLEGARSLMPVLIPAIMIIDRELGDGDGLDLIGDALQIGARALIVSTRNTVEDRINALSLGARDYLAKPAHPKEVFLRVQNSLSIPFDYRASCDSVRDFGGVRIDLATRSVLRADSSQSDELTSTELAVLRFLSQHIDRIVSRQALFPMVVGPGPFNKQSRAVDTCISRLRIKLRSADTGVEIFSVRQAGYVFRRQGGARAAAETLSLAK